MTTRRLWWLALLGLALLPSTGGAAEFPRPSLSQAFRAAGQYTIPAAWAGVWSYVDTTYECVTLAYVADDSGLDTLCVGQSFEPDSAGGFEYSCSGTITDNVVDLTCTGSFVLGPCTVTFDQRIQVTRSGETATSHTTMRTTYTPTMCLPIADSCQEFWSHMTRVEPAQPACATPSKQATWGALKVQYR